MFKVGGAGPRRQGAPRQLHTIILIGLVAVSLGDSSPVGSYSAACVVAKNENAYVREFVNYHKCLGLGKIYLYDHNSSTPLSSELVNEVQSGFVESVPFHNATHKRYKKSEGFADNLAKFGATVQGQAYAHCIATYGARHRWLGFFDVDEFVVLLDPSLKGINDLLQRFEQYGGLSLYWVLLGSSGHKTRPADWVTRSYTRCTPDNHHVNTQFKSFVNTAMQPTMYSPHRAMFAVQSPTSYLVDENQRMIAKGRNKESTHRYAAVYHYATKSEEDFEAKILRGGGAGVTRSRNYLEVLDRKCTRTCTGAVDTYARTCGGVA